MLQFSENVRARSFAWCTPDRLPMAVPRKGTSIAIYAVLTVQMMPQSFAETHGYDLYGADHVNGAWASQHCRIHVVIRVVYTAHIALRVEKGAKLVENCACYLYVAHHAD